MWYSASQCRAFPMKKRRTSSLPAPSALIAWPHGVWWRSVRYGPKRSR